MNIEEEKSVIDDIASKKKKLLIMRIKLSSGESVILKEMKKLRKDIARLFTKLNNIKV